MDAKQIQTIERLLSVIEKDIAPLSQTGVRTGNKVFGAAILLKSDLSLVVAATNAEAENPLWHGEVHAIKKLYEIPANKRPAPRDCLFLATHEPCSLCLSAITWGGYDIFYYLFSYIDSRNTFNIPHDLKILKEVFNCDHGSYAKENAYWKSNDIQLLINQCDPKNKEQFTKQIERIKATYQKMSDTYQHSKKGNDIPLN